jgi:hypothetical protein
VIGSAIRACLSSPRSWSSLFTATLHVSDLSLEDAYATTVATIR